MAELEVMLLDAPVDVLPQLELSLWQLNGRSGLEVLRTIAVERSERGAELHGVELVDAPGGEAESALRAAMGALGADEPSGVVGVPDAGAGGGALFGAESQAASLADELTDTARRLPDTRAALLVILRHAWRGDLVSVLSANDSEILIDRWPAGDPRDQVAQSVAVDNVLGDPTRHG